MARRMLEGSIAVAEAVAACRPEVIACYPITPQTHIVEALSRMVRRGELGNAQFVNVESEFASLSLLIGASAAGARTYTATTSQGLLFMGEAVYNAAGLGLPIVMTIANRAIGAPINIWNDHSDSMAFRDAGWVQFYAATNQEAADLHVQAYRIAEELSVPVMVCMDGFILTHAYEPVEPPTAGQVAKFLPPYEPIQVLDVNEPVSIGAMVGPEAFTEVRYLAHHKLLQVLELVPAVAEEFAREFGRRSGGLVYPYRLEDATAAVVALGSVNGTIQDAVDQLREEEGLAIGSLQVTTYRPFPHEAVREALVRCSRVIVVEKAFAPGVGGFVASDVRRALRGLEVTVHTVIAGLGGRNIPLNSLLRAFQEAAAGRLEEPHFLDLQREVVARELKRQAARRRSGPTAESILRDVGPTGTRIG